MLLKSDILTLPSERTHCCITQKLGAHLNTCRSALPVSEAKVNVNLNEIYIA